MDIKLIKNSDNGLFYSLNDKLLVQIVDSNFEYRQIRGKKYYIFNASTNERIEISPQIKKYYFCKIVYAAATRNYLFFSSLDSVNENRTQLSVYRFMFDTSESTLVYTIELDNMAMEEFDYEINVMDSNSFFLKKLKKTGAQAGVLLRDINAGININLKDTIIEKLGLYKVIPVGGNNCVLKFGENKIDSDSEIHEERIVLVNAKQFVSELAFDGSKLTLEELDVANDYITFPYIKISENKIIYSKYNLETKFEEIILYDCKVKVKQVRHNGTSETADDLSHTFMINDTPFNVYREGDETLFINLNNQKVEYQLKKNMDFRYLKNDIVIVTHFKHGIPFLRKPSPYIEAYRLSEMQRPMLSTKAEYNSCIVDGDDLLIFTN